MKEVNDRWIRISGISMLLLLDLYSYQIFVKPFGLDTLKYFIEFLLLTSTTWEANRWIIGRFRQWYPHLSQTRKRILLVLLDDVNSDQLGGYVYR